MENINMKITSEFISALVLTLSLSFTTPTAHADFRKALEAYQNRDGATMLKEVKDAVDTKSDNGLHIFIMQLRQQFLAKSFLSEVEIDKEKKEHINLYSFSTLLTEEQSIELVSLLDRAVQAMPRNNDYFESRIAMIAMNFARQQLRNNEHYIARSNALRELAIEAKGKLNDRQVIESIALTEYEFCEPNATAQLECLKLAAELGEPYTQSDLGLLYLGEKDKAKYSNLKTYSLITSVKADIKTASYWLKQSVSNSQFPEAPSAHCVIANRYQNGTDTQPIDLKQAYLLYLWDYLGNSGDGECAKDGLISMLNDGSLSKVAPAYYKLWLKNNKLWKTSAPPPLEGVKKLELPKLKSIKNQPSKFVFSYSGYGGQIYICSNGIVIFKQGLFTIDEWQIPSSEVDELVEAVRDLNFMDLPLYQGSVVDDKNGRFELNFSDKGQSKTIHGDNTNFSYKVYQIINKIIPNPYMSCNDINKPCFYKSFASYKNQ